MLVLPLLAAAAVAALAVGRAGAASAADECSGLPICLPVSGPWVVIPARTATQPARVQYLLRCPLEGYIVAGTDVRLADPDIDVSIRGETGSPVGPGVTTARAVLFVATYVGTRRAPTTFRPFVGCVPGSGGGGRALTGTRALRPTRPVTLRAGQRRVPAGNSARVVAACRVRETAVDASHAVAFRTSAPPTRAELASVRATHRFTGSGATATGVAPASLPSRLPALVQVIAHCRKDAP
jgi:hypothetical protein